jgi:pyruvate,water dikinase
MTSSTRPAVLGFHEIGQTQVAVVGGKGAHLGELSRIAGIRVPAGFCVTTDAFQRIISDAPSIDDRLERLSRLAFVKDETLAFEQILFRRNLLEIFEDSAFELIHIFEI